MAINMDPSARYKSGWNEGATLMRGPLTDKKIRSYEKRGFYSEEYRTARKDFAEKKHKRRLGSFDQMQDGRMIYRP